METYRYIIGYVDGRTAFNSDEIGKKNIDKLPKRVPIVVTTEGEEVQLTEGYYSENYITERIIGKNSIAVVQTLLINPNTNHIKWKIISMFAYHNNELEQIKFTTD